MVLRRRASAALALLLTIACVLLGGMPCAGAASTATAPHARLSIDDIDPAVATPDEAVTVSGTIDNPTDHDITPTVTAQVSPQLLDTVHRLENWTAGHFDAGGSTVGTQTLATVAPGESAPFAVRIPRKALRYTYQLASLPMTITAGGDGMSTQRVRTTLEWSTTPAAQPIDTTIVVPLTLPADPALFGPSGEKRDAAWEATIGPGSRIDELLTVMDGLPVTWLVDPELLDPPAPADPNLPETAPSGAVSPSPSTGTAPPSTAGESPGSTQAPTSPSTESPTSDSDIPTSSDEAPLPTPSTSGGGSSGTDTVTSLTERLLERLRRTADTSSVWWLPYDDPDLSALSSTRKGRTMLTRELKRGLPRQLTDISTAMVAWPAGAPSGKTTKRVASIWRKATGKKATLVLPRRAVSAAATEPDTTRRIKGTAGVLAYDEALSEMLRPDDGPVLAAQQFLAHTLAIYQQQPGAARSLTAVVPRDDGTPPPELAAEVRRILSASWVNGTSGRETRLALPTEADATAVKKPAKGHGLPKTPPSPVRTATLRQVDAERRTLRGLGSILVDADTVIASRSRGLDVIGSARWRGAADLMHTVQQANSSAVESMRTKVTVRPSAVNFFTSSGKLTITVVNHLDRPLKDINLSLVPRKYLLRIQDPVQSIELGASARTTVRFDVKAVGAGQVQVDAVLRTPTGLELGTAPGDTTQLKVNVRPTSSWIYWVLGIVAGLVLVVGLIRSVRRGPRELTTPGPDDEPMPTEPTAPDDPAEAGEDD